jgi:tetratricopeptide (TPR) repeat protein
MGEVYLAEDELLHRRVALKRVGRDLSRDPEYRRRLLREAQQAGRISDPRIAAVHDVIVEDDDVVLVMEYVEGKTFRERMQDGLALEDFWDLAVQCVEALDVAHRHGVLHRDIKPDNLIVDAAGRVKILDFGVAKRVFVEDGVTTASTDTIDDRIMGTPAYMPPEAHLGRALDERSDIFSLGIFFYEVLARRRPFTGSTRGEVVSRILSEPPVPLEEAAPGVPEPLSSVVACMLAKEPGRRYASAGDVREALAAARRGEFREPRTVPRRTRGSRRVSRTAAALLAVAALAGVMALAGGPGRFGAPAPLPLHPNLAVVPSGVSDTSVEERAFAFGAVADLTETLMRLARGSGVQVAPSADVLAGGIETPEQALERVGANLTLLCGLETRKNGSRVRLDLVDPVSGETVRSKTVSRPEDGPLAVVRAQRWAAAALLDIDLPEAVASAEEYGDATGAGTIRFYLEGRGHLATHRSLDDLALAEDRFELASQIDPGFGPARTGLGWVHVARYFLDGRDPRWLAAAKEEAEAGLAADSGRAGAHECLAVVLSRSGEVEAAETRFRRAAELDPTDDALYTEWGRMYGRRGDAAREHEIYDRAVRVLPGSHRAHLRLASFLYYRGKFDGARAEFETVVRLSPDYYKGYSNLGGIYVQEGRYEEAVAALDHSISLNPTEGALSNLGTAYFHNRDFERAISTYNRAFQYGFGNYLLWVNLGDAYYWAPGMRDRSTEAYERAVRLGREILDEKPYHVEVLADLAPVYARLGKVDSARVHVEAALDRASGNPNIEYRAALTYWELGEKELALDLLESAVRGGWPRVWIRDSVVFDSWRDEERMTRIVGEVTFRSSPFGGGKEQSHGHQGDSG